jgi:hypothetical protein
MGEIAPPPPLNVSVLYPLLEEKLLSDTYSHIFLDLLRYDS